MNLKQKRAQVDKDVEKMYRAHTAEHGLDPNPYTRAKLVDRLYVRACRIRGVRPLKK